MNKQIPVLLFLALILSTAKVFSQNDPKIGHANVLEILQALPETDSAQILIEKNTKDLELMLEEMQVEYNKLVNDYQENLDSYSEVIRSTKESDIVEMQNHIICVYLVQLRCSIQCQHAIDTIETFAEADKVIADGKGN